MSPFPGETLVAAVDLIENTSVAIFLPLLLWNPGILGLGCLSQKKCSVCPLIVHWFLPLQLQSLRSAQPCGLSDAHWPLASVQPGQLLRSSPKQEIAHTISLLLQRHPPPPPPFQNQGAEATLGAYLSLHSN